jgi:hypothetical protein
MIAIPVIYTIVGVFVFFVLQEIVGIPAALLTGLFWLPLLIIGIVREILQKRRWSKKFISQLASYPEGANDDLVDATAIFLGHAQATKFWLFWLAIGVVYELYAIIADKVDTLSERVWYWLGKHWIIRVAFIAFWTWAFIHIIFGPCAFGVC